MVSFPELYLTWRDTEYRCRVNMDVLTQIEQRVALQKLAQDIVFDAANIKVSHVAWVIFCILRGAGASVTADEVWQAMKDNQLSDKDVADVMQYVIAEIFGSGPEKTGKKQKAQAKGKGKKAS